MLHPSLSSPILYSCILKGTGIVVPFDFDFVLAKTSYVIFKGEALALLSQLPCLRLTDTILESQCDRIPKVSDRSLKAVRST